MSAPVCTDCVSGVIHSGTPKGRTSTIYGLETYVAEPPDGSPTNGLIVVIPDVFGWELTNVRVLADVVSGVQALIGLTPFLLHRSDSTVLPTIATFLRSVRENEGCAHKIGIAGFCYGGRLAILVAHNDERTSTTDGKPLADVVFTGHPAEVKIPVEFEKVRLPLSIAIGSKDSWMSLQQIGEVRKILDKKVQADHEIVVYDGVKHGFTVRGNPGNEAAAKQGIEAEDQAVAWFKRFLGQT
ncbi:MAG: hypothetical protein M1813_006775 [Trichoglossum hirsutum]|nr:MAG: hypothetical protein M1813_006775 [Trichoglossum hirsutum]